MGTNKEKPIFRASFRKLGTDITLILIIEEEKNKEDCEKVLGKIKELYQKKEKIFSRFDSESELCFLNNDLGKFQKASADIIHLARNSIEYNEQSQGFFDPRIIDTLEQIGYDGDFGNINPNQEASSKIFDKISKKLREDLEIRNDEILFKRRMDFSGIAKGYITDQAALLLKKYGWKNFLLDSGGDIFVSGLDQFGKKWKISIEGFSEDRFNFEISNQSVASSGITRRKWEKNGERYHHIVNPKDPEKFLFVLKSVSVISGNSTEADVMAKVLFLMGKDNGLEFSKKNGIKSIFLDSRGNLFLSNAARITNIK